MVSPLSLLQALELPENHGIRNQIRDVVGRLRQLPRNLAAMQPPAAANGSGSKQLPPDGPQALLALCRDLAMQVKVSGFCLCVCLCGWLAGCLC